MRLVQSTRAAEVWRQFADAWGPEVLLNSYGWHQPPAETRPLELFYEYYDDEQLIGWGSLTRHPLAQSYWMSLGLFPDSVDKHYYRPFRDAMIEEAFRLGAREVTSIIMDTNPEHQNNALGRCKANPDSGMQYAGQVWHPIGYKIFTEAREVCPGCKYVMAYCRCCGGQGFVFDH